MGEKTTLFGEEIVAKGNLRLLVGMAWMKGFREGAQAAALNMPGAHERAFRRAGGVNRLIVASDEVLVRVATPTPTGEEADDEQTD